MADGVRRLQLRWPEAPPAFPFAAGWFRGCSALVDSPFARALAGGHWISQDSELTIRD